MTPDEMERRKRLTFEEAEGLAPLPSQLKTGEISPKFRAMIWAELHHHVYNTGLFPLILQDAWVRRYHYPVDAFPKTSAGLIQSWLKPIVLEGAWSGVLGLLEFILRHPNSPRGYPAALNGIMVECALAYRVIDNQVICPIGSGAERASIEKAFSDLRKFGLFGAQTHLRKAAEALTAGRFADSVRESIHAVESVAEMLEPSGELTKALAKLEASANIHGAMKRGFAALYGYSSNEQGIRHALLENGDAAVDETDALFMIGACAAFVSYLVNKARSAGLLTAK